MGMKKQSRFAALKHCLSSSSLFNALPPFVAVQLSVIEHFVRTREMPFGERLETRIDHYVNLSVGSIESWENFDWGDAGHGHGHGDAGGAQRATQLSNDDDDDWTKEDDDRIWEHMRQEEQFLESQAMEKPNFISVPELADIMKRTPDKIRSRMRQLENYRGARPPKRLDESIKLPNGLALTLWHRAWSHPHPAGLNENWKNNFQVGVRNQRDDMEVDWTGLTISLVSATDLWLTLDGTEEDHAELIRAGRGRLPEGEGERGQVKVQHAGPGDRSDEVLRGEHTDTRLQVQAAAVPPEEPEADGQVPAESVHRARAHRLARALPQPGVRE